MHNSPERMKSKHIACICDPGNSHIMNFAAIADELKRRGHRFTVFHLPDLEPKVRAHGLEFSPLPRYRASAEPRVDPGAMLHDSSLREFLFWAKHNANTFCSEAPRAFRSANVDAVLVDMSEPGAASAAEAAGLPFITVCNAIPLHGEPAVPPDFSPWPYSTNAWAKLRNRAAYSVRDLMIWPLHRTVNHYRRRHALRAYRSPEDSFSPFAQITQLVPEFDFPRKRLPDVFHYVGPYRRGARANISFPYERLDGKPLVYASLGTVLGGRKHIWQAIVDGCAGLDIQLVISLGGRDGAGLIANLSSNTIVVKYAPQQELLSRAAVAITHAGLNSVMEALAAGAPLVAVPMTGDQFSVAARIAYTRVGEVIQANECSGAAVGAAVRKILDTSAYRDRESVIRAAIEKTRGATSAADIIEEVIATRRPILRCTVPISVD